MDTERNVDQQIQAEIEQLRRNFPQTQDLYREACVLLFFRYGITPTANKLYQYVRKGSMSAPAEALAKFWNTLREKSRVRVEHPDLPEDLRVAAGELTASLWNRAQAAAQENLAAFRSEAQASTLEAEAARKAAEAERDSARGEAATLQGSLAQAGETVRELERRLAAEGATRAAMERRIEESGREMERLQSAIEEARRDFAAELEKHRASAELAEERFRATEQRALLEIDRERTQAAKAQKDLEQSRLAASQAADRHQAEVAALHAELGQLRQRVGILEGMLQAAQSERDRVFQDAETLRGRVTDVVSEAAGHRADADNWRSRAEEAHRALADLQAKIARRPRKVAPEEKEGKLL
ncbi:MAG TPA: DNA-binding protein [Rhodocyclaceae bacterium]